MEKVVEGASSPEKDNLTSEQVQSSSVPVEVPRAMRFFEVVGKLKTLKRTGWVHHGIPLPESVSDHMYRMSMLCFMITDSRVDKDRLMKICMVHDLAEALVGDITPHCGVSKEDKRKLEEQALRNIVTDIDCPSISNEILSLWLAYEEQTCLEAQIAHQLDKLEMIIQASEYEKAHADKVLESFFTSTRDDFKHPEVLAWAEAVREERRDRLAAKK